MCTASHMDVDVGLYYEEWNRPTLHCSSSPFFLPALTSAWRPTPDSLWYYRKTPSCWAPKLSIGQLELFLFILRLILGKFCLINLSCISPLQCDGRGHCMTTMYLHELLISMHVKASVHPVALWKHSKCLKLFMNICIWLVLFMLVSLLSLPFFSIRKK